MLQKRGQRNHLLVSPISHSPFPLHGTASPHMVRVVLSCMRTALVLCRDTTERERQGRRRGWESVGHSVCSSQLQEEREEAGTREQGKKEERRESELGRGV